MDCDYFCKKSEHFDESYIMAFGLVSQSDRRPKADLYAFGLRPIDRCAIG
jgi:hypothetical protein